MKRIDLTRASIGSWCQIGHPANAEIVARAGFEWIAADCEHGEFEDGHIGSFCRAVRPFACEPMVRVQENAELPIRRALDLGASGVFVPLVNDPDQAARAVSAANYPPAGARGFAWKRANAWGADFEAYAREFDPVVIAMIESQEAVESIDGIMATPGVDGCLIGPYDMSGSYGVVGQTEHPDIREASRRVAEACRRHGKAAGQHIVAPTEEKIGAAVDQGYTLLALGMDTVFLQQGAHAARRLH